MLNIYPRTSETTGFETTIINYLKCTLPEISHIDGENLVQVLAGVLLGTKNTRVGPLPIAEVQVNIKTTIRLSVEQQLPIPILVAWGGVKMSKSGDIDTAEISALRTLLNFNLEIKKYYKPGLSINIRIEDTGAWNLYKDFNIDSEIEQYSYNFANLVSMVGGDILNPIRESSLMNLSEFNTLVDKYSKLIFEYMNYSNLYPDQIGKDTSYFNELLNIGWKGPIPMEQRNYYKNLYSKLYPNKSDEYYTKLLSIYLAGAKARYELNGRATPTILPNNNHISMSFVSEIPGAPQTLFGNTIYIRTAQANCCRTHIPAWRSFGYLEIDSVGNCTPKITNWSTAQEMVADGTIETEDMIMQNEQYQVPIKVSFKII